MRIARLQSFGFGAQLQEQAVKLFRQFLLVAEPCDIHEVRDRESR